MDKLELKNLTANTARSYSFYQIPREIIDNPAFDGIDYGSKLLYALMLNRASMSSRNRDFIDENGDVFIIYKIEEIQENMRCGSQLAVKMLKQLSDIGLIEKKVRGQGKPMLIYVKNFDLSQSLNSENQNPKILNSESQELLDSKSKSEKLPYNNIKYKDLSNKDQRESTAPASASEETPPQKQNYGEFQNVKMTTEEYETLINRFDKTFVMQKIDSLDCNIQNKVKKYCDYKDHYATILNWCKKDGDDESGAQSNQKPKFEEI